MKINHDFKRQSTLVKKLDQLRNEKNIFAYLKNRAEWHFLPRILKLKKYPLHVDFETTSHCQMQCPMCFRAHREIENQGVMDFRLYKKLIDELDGKIYSIKFTGRGEPLLNKQFSKFLDYLQGKSFGEVALITNGQLMTPEIMHKLIDNEVDRVAFSIDGLKDKYEKIRSPMTYDKIIQIVSELSRIKKERNTRKPLVRISAVESLIDDKQQFQKIWERISDEIFYLVFKDYSSEMKIKRQEGYACPLLYQRMVIHWNGHIPMCINDEYEESLMGNAVETTVSSIWRGEYFSEAREVHKHGQRDSVYTNCASCALHREGHGYSSALSKINTNIIRVKKVS